MYMGVILMNSTSTIARTGAPHVYGGDPADSNSSSN